MATKFNGLIDVKESTRLWPQAGVDRSTILTVPTNVHMSWPLAETPESPGKCPHGPDSRGGPKLGIGQALTIRGVFRESPVGFTHTMSRLLSI